MMPSQFPFSLSDLCPCGPINAAHGVFLVRHRKTGKLYVKKLLTVYDRTVYEGLQAEPVSGLPRIRLLTEEEGLLTVIEDYVPGITLEELLRERGALPLTEAVGLLRQLCCIVSRLHRRRPALVHRDIKPSNVMLTPSGRVVLLDLNAARQNTRREADTRLLGTRGYAAPEQYGFGSSGPRADIYALGRLLNTLLWGEYRTEIYPDKSLGKVISACLKMDPKQRPRSAAALKRRLKAALRHRLPARRELRSFLPPGFRQGRLWHMLAAALGYGFIFIFCRWPLSQQLLEQQAESSVPAAFVRFCRVMYGVLFFSWICIFCNYRDIWRLMPLCRAKKRLWRMLGVLLLMVAAYYLTLLLVEIVGRSMGM